MKLLPLVSGTSFSFPLPFPLYPFPSFVRSFFLPPSHIALKLLLDGSEFADGTLTRLLFDEMDSAYEMSAKE